MPPPLRQFTLLEHDEEDKFTQVEEVDEDTDGSNLTNRPENFGGVTWN